MAAMTPDVLKQLCKQNGGYAQPTLNDQLYLQCKGFVKIENLEPYTQLKVLWLEQNAITDIEGLDTLSKLVSLFLQNNTIRRIANLNALGNLRILNLSHNYISRIEGLADCCPLLESLQISHNVLPALEACTELWGLPELSSVDLSFNKLERQEGDSDMCIVDFFRRMPQVSVIYLQGNPLSHGMKQYRKNMVLHLPGLTYLDERPVFPDERRTTEAWGRGGDAAETEERGKIRAEKKEEISNCVETMARAMEQNKELRDKQNAQWQQRRAEELEELKIKRQAWRREQQQVDSAEFDARGGIEADEDDAWSDLLSMLSEQYATYLREEAELKRKYDRAAELEQVRVSADKELKEQEERISAVLMAQPQGQAQDHSMQYWIKMLDQTDEQILQSMEEDLEGFLSELQPGFKMPSLVRPPAAAPKSVPPQAAAATSKAVAAPRFSSSSEKAATKEKMWEQYYRWECAHTR